MVSNGFADLADGNPALAYQVIVDLLAGINDNESIRRHLSASTQLFPRGSLRQSIKMTDKGPVLQHPVTTPITSGTDDDSESDIETSSKDSAQQRGPIAEMLYSRWLEVRSVLL
jgi:serine/threonine-protein kinase 24/25/MST4